MFLSYNPKFIFVHIPKTAGTSISTCLKHAAVGKIEQGCQKCSWDFHTTARQFKHKLGSEQYDASFTFSFVRNPWDWMYSWYAMHSQHNKMSFTFKEWLMDYEHIMRKTFLSDEEPIASQKRGQLDWLTDKEGNIIVDFIGKFETLEKDFNVVRKNLNLKSNLPKMNTTNHGKYRDAYDDEMIEFVQKYCQKDIEEFGYEF